MKILIAVLISGKVLAFGQTPIIDGLERGVRLAQQMSEIRQMEAESQRIRGSKTGAMGISVDRMSFEDQQKMVDFEKRDAEIKQAVKRLTSEYPDFPHYGDAMVTLMEIIKSGNGFQYNYLKALYFLAKYSPLSDVKSELRGGLVEPSKAKD